MEFKVDADLVPLFRGLVSGLQPFAKAQEVELLFQSPLQHLYASYNPEETLSEITVLLSRIITFTPQTFKVLVCMARCSSGNDCCNLTITNTGVDLSKLGEIISSVSTGLKVENLKKGTRFIIEIPTVQNSNMAANSGVSGLLPKQYPRYYSEINKRLSSHFSNMDTLEIAAKQRGHSEGIFLKKINAVIRSHMDNSEFKVDHMANAMPLSRAQLYRRVKALTKMSPSQYLRFVRLETAKNLLQARDNDLNVTEVCYKVGFASTSHFTRSFQKEFGFNPSYYK